MNRGWELELYVAIASVAGLTVLWAAGKAANAFVATLAPPSETDAPDAPDALRRSQLRNEIPRIPFERWERLLLFLVLWSADSWLIAAWLGFKLGAGFLGVRRFGREAAAPPPEGAAGASAAAPAPVGPRRPGPFLGGTAANLVAALIAAAVARGVLRILVGDVD